MKNVEKNYAYKNLNFYLYRKKLHSRQTCQTFDKEAKRGFATPGMQKNTVRYKILYGKKTEVNKILKN